LYVPKDVFDVWPVFLHATPLEILVAASAGVAIMTLPATISATDSDAILRNIYVPFVVMGQYYRLGT
jgi:hypothetical protein